MNELAKPNAELTQMAHSMMPFAQSLGLEIFDCSPERVVARAGWRAERCTAEKLIQEWISKKLAHSKLECFQFLAGYRRVEIIGMILVNCSLALLHVISIYHILADI